MTIKEIESRLNIINGKIKWNDLLSYEQKQELLREAYYLKNELYKKTKKL